MAPKCVSQVCEAPGYAGSQGVPGEQGSIGCGGRAGSVLLARVPTLSLPHHEDREAMGQNRPEIWVISSAGGFQDWTKLRAGRCGPALATTSVALAFSKELLHQAAVAV